MARFNTRSLISAVLVVAAAQANAWTLDVESVTASSEIGGTFDRQDDYLIDGSGLNALGEHTSSVETNMWLSAANGFGGIDADPKVVFDLGAIYTLDALRVWNYNENPPNLTNRGVKNVTVNYGTTAALGSTVAGITQFAQASGANTYTGELFDLSSAPIQARYIEFDIASGINNGNWGDGNTFYGLSEVQFNATLSNTITGVTVEDFTSQLNGFGGRLAVDTINSSGFNDATGEHNNNAADMWLSDGDGVNETNEGENGLPTSITFDLENNYNLDAIGVWNYNEVGLTSRGAREVAISVASGEGGVFNPLGLFELEEATGANNYEGQLISLEDFVLADDVRRIRFDINSNWGDANQYVGLSEIRFSGTVIPEPSSLALLGLGGLALLRRRR
jgi:hypothetical protein